MRLPGLLAVALLATTACQPHLAPVDTTSPLARDGEFAGEAAAAAGSDALEAVESEPSEGADASSVGRRREETARGFGRLSSRTRLLTGARDAIRERRRR